MGPIANDNARVLLVDDDEDDYLIVRSLLAKIPRSPFKLDWVSSYKEAERRINESTYDLYLIDYRLGSNDGLQLLELAKPYRRSEPFIILTGAGDERIEQRAMRLGAADYLVKGTFSPELLSRTLRYALQRKRIEEQRVQHLIEISKAKDEFISLASHQLRTPATGVKQYIGMVLEGFAGDVSDKQQLMLEKAYESNERQLQIVSNLLRVAQVDAGKVKLRRGEVDIIQLIEDVLREQDYTFKRRKQEVVFIKPDKAVKAYVDTYNIRMVLENIVDNASKYTPENKEITVELEHSKEKCIIHIKDEGVGISKVDQGKLFEKFARIENPLSTLVGGSGLGLYWAKKIIDLHDGDIKLTSRIGKGTTFSICLPTKHSVPEVVPDSREPQQNL